MTKKQTCFYCDVTELESITAEERYLALKNETPLPVISDPFDYYLEKPICSNCKEKLSIELKKLI